MGDIEESLNDKEIAKSLKKAKAKSVNKLDVKFKDENFRVRDFNYELFTKDLFERDFKLNLKASTGTVKNTMKVSAKFEPQAFKVFNGDLTFKLESSAQISKHEVLPERIETALKHKDMNLL